MLVGPVGADSLSPYLSASASEPVEVPLREPLALPELPTSEPVESPAAVEVGEEHVEQEAVPGVLRLLMAGHFKGVADVRLRIVFHDELQAMQAEATKTAAAEAAGALTGAVGVSLDELASSGALVEEQAIAVGELQQAFEQAADEAVEQFKTAPDVDEGALTNGLQSAFDSLSRSLETLLAPPAPDEPDEALPGPVVEEPAIALSAPDEPDGALPGPVVEEPAVAPSALEVLKDAFDTGMVQVDEALAAPSILPSLSSPRGNGVAYEKFLAVYEELNALPEPIDDTQDQADEVVGSMDAEA